MWAIDIPSLRDGFKRTSILIRPDRDEMPLAHKFICGNQIPAPPSNVPSRMGRGV